MCICVYVNVAFTTRIRPSGNDGIIEDETMDCYVVERERDRFFVPFKQSNEVDVHSHAHIDAGQSSGLSFSLPIHSLVHQCLSFFPIILFPSLPSLKETTRERERVRRYRHSCHVILHLSIHTHTSVDGRSTKKKD